MKDWMKGPFLEIKKTENTGPEVITLYPHLFKQLFDTTNRYSAFYDYQVFYHTDMRSENDVKVLLENFTQCQCCEQWFDRDDLIDTEQMIGGGTGLQCEDCVSTLG